MSGEKDFTSAWEKRYKQRESQVDDFWEGKRDDIAADQRLAEAEHLAMRATIKKRQETSGISAIGKDLDDTITRIGQYTEARAKESELNADRAMMARSNMKAEERRKKIHIVKDDEDVVVDEKTKKPKVVKKTGSISSVRAGAESVDVAKILAENSAQVAQMTAAMKGVNEALIANSKRPIEVTSMLDGRKIGESIQRAERKKIRGM